MRLLAREGELEAFEHAVQDVRDGGSRTLVIVGEAGINNPRARVPLSYLQPILHGADPERLVQVLSVDFADLLARGDRTRLARPLDHVQLLGAAVAPAEPCAGRHSRLSMVFIASMSRARARRGRGNPPSRP